MFRKFISVFLFTALVFALVSCEKDDTVKNDEGNGTMAYTYTVNYTSKPITASDDWDSLQWKDAEVLELKNFMGDKPEHFPKIQARLLYDDDNLYVFFRAEDNYILALAEETHGNVWQDSCVEMFFSPDAENFNSYFNLETNCGGTVLFWCNDYLSGEKKPVSPADCEKLEIYHSLAKIIAEEITEPTTWTLGYKVPFDLIAKYSKVVRPAGGVKWRANFFKCADKTSHPHWLTWSKIDLERPDFHVPEYFGTLIFAEKR